MNEHENFEIGVLEVNGEITSFFKLMFIELKAQGFKFKKVNESPGNLSAVFLYLDNNYEEIEDLLENIDPLAQLYICTNLSNLKEAECLTDLLVEFSEVEFVIDLDSNEEYYRGIKNSLVASSKKLVNEDFDKEMLVDINLELDSLYRETQKELLKIKEIHEKIIPLRKQKINGVQLTSKYAAGSSAGGDFFDLVSNDNTMVIIFSSTNSYALSSLVITEFSKFSRSELREESILTFYKNIELEKKEISSKKELRFDLFIFSIEINSLTGKFYNYGKTTFLKKPFEAIEKDHQIKGIIEKPIETASLQLKRDDKYLILSPNVIENLGIDWFRDERLATLNSGDILNEIFYKLKKEAVGDFLDSDASVIIIEIDKNAIHSI